MNWNDINVYQWQQLQQVLNNRPESDTDLDLAVKCLSIITNKTELEIDFYSIEQLNKELKKTEFLHHAPNPKAVDHIEINGRRYKCIYDIRRLPFARYFETKYFSNDVSKNLHNIAGCMVMPMTKNWLGRWVVDKYDASKHEEYAQDMLEAKFVNVYGAVVFFYLVFKGWIKTSKGFLVSEMMKSKKMTTWEAEALVKVLCEAMDGFISPNLSQNLKD
jgi:hypothetical protein